MVFAIINVVDTCSVENILSSLIFYNAIKNSRLKLCYTKAVEYEMFFKKRKNMTTQSNKVRKLLMKETQNKHIECHSLSVADLQNSGVINMRHKYGMGEISSIAFAKKISQGFLTDDKGARKLGEKVLGIDSVSTTPRLYAWLFYNNYLIDQDHSDILEEHKANLRPLESYLTIAYEHAMKVKMYENSRT